MIKAQANFDKALETSKKVKEAATALSNAKSKAKSDYLNSQEYKDKTAAASKISQRKTCRIIERSCNVHETRLLIIKNT